MVLGAIPLVIATGAGAESRMQIGWVIVGGMTLGTLLTLFVVPCAYSIMGRSMWARRLKRRSRNYIWQSRCRRRRNKKPRRFSAAGPIAGCDTAVILPLVRTRTVRQLPD